MMSNSSSDDFSSIVDCLSKFQTQYLDADWVKTTWETDISQVDFLPNEFEQLHESTDWIPLLQDACQEIRKWVQPVTGRTLAGKNKSLAFSSFREPAVSEADQISIETESSSFWSALIENGIDLKSLVIISSFLLNRGSNSSADFVEKERAIAAARFYISFICIPGSSAYRLFHAVLYQRVIDLFTMIKAFGSISEVARAGRTRRSSSENSSTSTVKRKRTGRTASHKRPKTAGGPNRARQLIEDLDMEEEIEDDIEHDGNARQSLTLDNIKTLTKSLIQLLLDLQLLFKCFSLKHHVQSMDHTIRRLYELFSQEYKHCSEKLMRGAQSTIKTLCMPFHGNVKDIIILVAKHCLNILLCTANRNVLNFLCSLIKFVPNGDAVPAMQRLIQHLCMKVPERAEARSKIGSLIFTVMNELPPTALAGSIKWLLSYILGTKVAHRVFALEVIALILGNLPREFPREGIPADQRPYLSYTCLLKAVLTRCKDVAATVRAKALSVLASCLATQDTVLHSTIKFMFTPSPLARLKPPAARTPCMSQGTSDITTDIENMLEDCAIDTSTQQSTDIRSKPTGNSNTLSGYLETDLPDYEATLELLRKKASDEKVHVRKAAIQVLHHIMELNLECISMADIVVLRDHCRDISLLVRKQALQSLTSVLESCPSNVHLQQAWLQAVLPAILDAETSIQEKCTEFIDEIILRNIVAYQRSNTHSHTMAWSLMTAIAKDDSNSSWRYMKRVLCYLARSGKLRQNLVLAVNSHIDTENDKAAWLLLSELASHCSLKNVDFVYHYWDCHQKDIEDHTECMNHVLQVLGAVAKNTDDAKLFAYFGKLSCLLEEFTCPFSMIPTLVETISKLCCSAKSSEKAQALFQSLCGRILKAVDKYLSYIILTRRRNSQEINEDTVIKHLCTLGEISMMRPNLMPTHIFLVLESILAAPCLAQSDNVLLQGCQGIQGSQPLSQFAGSLLSKRLRNFALITVGKLCLQHENFAKKCIPALGNELEKSDDPCVRNNIVVILVDLCKRYTTLVDVYFPCITACLKDSSLLVRRQTLALLTQLLQEDYIKWRGSVFFCFLTALVDDLEDIRIFAEYALLHVLTKRHPTMFFQNFVECLFFFNSYQDHEAYNKIAKSEKEAKLFSLVGNKNASKRMTLYKFMLEQMSDEHRFNITTKLCQEILGGVVEDDIKLKKPGGEICVNGQALVKDTLAVLCCEEIKLASLRASPQEELEDGDVVAALVATTKKTIISQVVKKNAVENIVPIVIALKHKLEKLLSPLLQDLMFYLKEMMKDYKNEVKDILAADKQLTKEIDYDMKKFEQQQEEQRNQTNIVQKRCASSENTEPLNSSSSTTATKKVVLAAAANVANQDSVRSTCPNLLNTRVTPLIETPAAENGVQQRVLPDPRQTKITEVTNNLNCTDTVTVEPSKLASPNPLGKNLRRLTPKKMCKPMVIENLTLISQSSHSSDSPVDDTPISKRLLNTGFPVKQEQESSKREVIVTTPQTSHFQAFRNTLRAISTPCNVITDITFNLDTENEQCKRLSPIAEDNTVSSPSMTPPPIRQWCVTPLTKRFSLMQAVDNSDESD